LESEITIKRTNRAPTVTINAGARLLILAIIAIIHYSPDYVKKFKILKIDTQSKKSNVILEYFYILAAGTFYSYQDKCFIKNANICFNS